MSGNVTRMISLASGTLPEFGPVEVTRAAADAGFHGCGIWFDSQTWATRGIIAFVDGRYREAELSLKKALEAGVHELSADINIIRYHQIWAIERQGRLDEAD